MARQTFTDALFTNAKAPDLGLVITIPAYAEENLLESLKSLKECTLPPVGVEVIVIINHPENGLPEHISINQEVYELAQKWASNESTPQLQFLISKPLSLPKKHAGAGLARKIAMDEAVRRLQDSSVENPVIAAFDGDATCAKNYLVAVHAHFITHENALGCAIYFEHPLNVGSSTFNQESIIQYELHLRYYQAAMVYAKHPYAQFTVGSSMAVTRDGYVLQGGMNRRKAGEDFWFMLKLMMAGEVSDLTETTVFPSSRESFRVPFGTGRSMTEMQEKNDFTFYTSKFESFERLKMLLTKVDDLYTFTVEVDDTLTLQFLESQNWIEVLDEIRLYTTDKPSFKKRFYRWFNSFMVMKFFHFLRDEGESDVPVNVATTQLLSKMTGVPNKQLQTPLEQLQYLQHKKSVQSNDYTL